MFQQQFGVPLDRQEFPQGSVGVLTSGGDCQGMNSVLYGIACRHAITKLNESEFDKINPNELYFIKNGYAGLLDPEHSIIKADIKFLRKHIHLGGTVIGSSRCMEFYSQDGRRRAAYNLLKLNIQNLIIIGGDGSLTGAKLLREEWPQYASELCEKGVLNNSRSSSKLFIIGIIGSIDNDFAGSEMTVGADSALFRVVEAIDCLKTTSRSHKRAMVIEVMGRDCGYLAISVALATEASYCFIPEYPQKSTLDWKEKLTARMELERSYHQYHHIIVVAEGACEVDGSPIKVQTVKDHLSKECHIESRAVILGHLQRGGYTSAFDHLMSIQMGIEAYNHLAKAQEALVLTINKGDICAKSLMDSIREIALHKKFVEGKDWSRAVESRGANFQNTWENYNCLIHEPSGQSLINNQKSTDRWGIVMYGQPVSGMNAIIYAVVRYGLAKNCGVYGFLNGLEGLCRNNYHLFQWGDVSDIVARSGVIIGSEIKNQSNNEAVNWSKICDKNIRQIVSNLQSLNIKFLLFVGNRGAYNAISALNEYRDKFPYVDDMKLSYIPVSLSDINSPDEVEPIKWSNVGRDSRLNKTIQLIRDVICSSMGCGADVVYPIRRSDLLRPFIDTYTIREDASRLKDAIMKNQDCKFVLIHETWWENVVSIYKQCFDNTSPYIKLHIIDLCSIQQPSLVTPYDRKLGVKLGLEVGRFFSNGFPERTPLCISTPLLHESSSIKRRDKEGSRRWKMQMEDSKSKKMNLKK